MQVSQDKITWTSFFIITGAYLTSGASGGYVSTVLNMPQ